jgi:hypothetical protein
MKLFKLLSRKSSCDALVEQSEQHVANSTLNDKVNALWGELSDLDSELRKICDRQDALHERLGGLENLTLVFGEESPVSIYPSN